MRPLALCAAALALAASGCGKKAEPEVPKSVDGTFPPGSGFSAEFTPFQGKWAVVKLEVPAGGNSPPIGPVSDADRDKIVVQVTGTLVKLDIPGDGDRVWTRYLVLTLNPQPSPRELDLIDSNEEGDTGPRSMATKSGKVDVPRDRYEAVYKFEGDTTVIALPLESRAKRPTEFKPALVPVGGGVAKVPVVVVHLKKKP